MSPLASRCSAASSHALSGLTTSPEKTTAGRMVVSMTHQSGNSHQRHFSTVQTELTDILTREIAEEESNGSSTMPEDLAELKAQIEESWRVVDGGVSGDGSGVVRLFKKEPLEGSGAKVAIAFHCQDTIPSESDESTGSLFDQMTEGGGGDEEDEEDAVAVRFTVMVSRAGKTMIYTCLSEDAVANVERVAVVDGDDIEDLIANGVDEKAYQGPEFTELAEDLQGSLCEFIDDVAGIDTDVASFVAMYADYKEQTEYVDWLRKVKSMV